MKLKKGTMTKIGIERRSKEQAEYKNRWENPIVFPPVTHGEWNKWIEEKRKKEAKKKW